MRRPAWRSRSRAPRSPRCERPRDRHAVVAVAHEVRAADPVDVDRRQRLAAAHRGRDPLPARAHARGGRPERAIEAGLAVDRPDDRVDGDDLDREVALADAPERRDDLVEGQDQVEVARLARRPAAQPRASARCLRARGGSRPARRPCASRSVAACQELYSVSRFVPTWPARCA